MLLIFIVGPGGSHLLEGGWRARRSSLRPWGCALLRPLQPVPGQGPSGPWTWTAGWAPRNGRTLAPRGPVWWQGMDPCPNEQAHVTEMPEMGRAGRRRLVSWKCGRPRSRADSPPPATPVPGGEGKASPALGTCWALDAKGKPTAGGCPTGPPEPAELPRGAVPGRPSRRKHCTVKTGPACCTARPAVRRTSVRPPPSSLPSFCTDCPSRPHPSHRPREPLSPDLPLIWPWTPWGGRGGRTPGPPPEQVSRLLLAQVSAFCTLTFPRGK